MKQQRGSTIVGFIAGLVLGLAVALGVAVYVTKVPIPFLHQSPSRTADRTRMNRARTRTGTRTRRSMARIRPNRC
jgi:cell division protein FtsN